MFHPGPLMRSLWWPCQTFPGLPNETPTLLRLRSRPAPSRRHGRGGRRRLDGFAMCTSLLLMREGQERLLPHFLPHHSPRPGGVNKEPFDRRAIKKALLNNEGTDHSISQKEPPLMPYKKKNTNFVSACYISYFQPFSHQFQTPECSRRKSLCPLD